ERDRFRVAGREVVQGTDGGPGDDAVPIRGAERPPRRSRLRLERNPRADLDRYETLRNQMPAQHPQGLEGEFIHTALDKHIEKRSLEAEQRQVARDLDRAERDLAWNVTKTGFDVSGTF